MIVDTNAVSALLAADPGVAQLLGSQEAQLPVVVIGEYLYGLRRSRDRLRLERLLRELARKSTVLPIDETTADVYAEVREELRGAGTPIPLNDLWIAALAVQHRLPVVSRDRHFDVVRGLVRIGW